MPPAKSNCNQACDKRCIGWGGMIDTHALPQTKGMENPILFSICHKRQSQVSSLQLFQKTKNNIETTSIKRSIAYCLQVAEKYNCEVYFILLCNGQISPPVKIKLSVNFDNPYWWQPHSAFWAKKCIFVPKVAINSDNDADQSLDPLGVLALYISSNDEERLKLKDVANSTI